MMVTSLGFVGFFVQILINLTDCFGDSTVTPLFLQALQTSQESIHHKSLFLLSLFQWGVGQPSLVSMDKAGKAWLFYTYGDGKVTKTVVRECDFSDLDAPVVGDAVDVSTSGLKNLNGRGDFINNADFAYDAEKNRFYLASDCHPNPTDAQPDFIASHFRVAYFDGGDLAKAKWTNMANIGPVDTGFARNHNVGLVRDAYGHTLATDYITVYYTVANTGTYTWSHLGTYRLHEFHLLVLK